MPVMTKGRKGPGSRIQVPEMNKTELRKPSAENPLAEWSAPEQQVATPTYQNPNEMQSLWQPVELQLPLPMPLLNGGFLALALGSGIASNRIVLVFSMISQLIASGIGVFGFGFGFVSGDGSHVMPNAYYQHSDAWQFMQMQVEMETQLRCGFSCQSRLCWMLLGQLPIGRAIDVLFL